MGKRMKRETSMVLKIAGFFFCPTLFCGEVIFVNGRKFRKYAKRRLKDF